MKGWCQTAELFEAKEKGLPPMQAKVVRKEEMDPQERMGLETKERVNLQPKGKMKRLPKVELISMRIGVNEVRWKVMRADLDQTDPRHLQEEQL